MSRPVHPIEERSYRILRERVDTSGFGPLRRAVVERVIHASADLAYLTDLVLPAEPELAAAAAALRDGVPLVADSRMLAAGVTCRPVLCAMPRGQVRSGTRAAAGVRSALHRVGPGAVWAVGNAPTALRQLLELDAAPLLVVGLPVGFVGAAEAKAALAESGWPCVTNRSEKGGAAVAAAAVNALLYAEPAP